MKLTADNKPYPAIGHSARQCGKKNRNTAILSTPRGFTLIELLVVIAIVALLVSILMPSLKRAREIANKVLCASNEKSIGVGAMLYAQDYEQWLPYATYSSSIRWWTKLGPFMQCEKYGPIPYTGNESPLTVSSPTIWGCPTTRDQFWLGYGWNYQGIGAASTDPRFGPTKLGTGKENCYLIADGPYAQNVTSSSYRVTFRGGFDTLPTPTGMTPDLYTRVHDDGLNTLFVDGHVEWLQTDDFLLANQKAVWGFFKS